MLVLLSAELYFRVSESNHWYSQVIRQEKREKVDFLFIGSSRTAACVDSNEFCRSVSSHFRRTARAINLGQGGSTTVEHYLGLRKMVRENRYALRQCTIFIENQSRVPACETWNHAWYNPPFQFLLTQLMEPEDLYHYWQLGTVTFDDKCMVTLSCLSSLFSERAKTASAFRSQWRHLSESLLDRRCDHEDADLTSAGDILRDWHSVEEMRRASLEWWGGPALHAQGPQRDWDHSVLKDLISLVKLNGGTIVFYDMPMHSLQTKVIGTAMRQTDAQAFVTQAQKWDCPILSPKFSTVDADFPDYMHMRKSLAPSYSRALAANYLDYIEGRSNNSSTLRQIVLTPDQNVQ